MKYILIRNDDDTCRIFSTEEKLQEELGELYKDGTLPNGDLYEAYELGEKYNFIFVDPTKNYK